MANKTRDLSEKGILCMLLDKYESSKAAIGNSKRGIILDVRKKIPEVFSVTEFEKPTEVIDSLEEKGLVLVKERTNGTAKLPLKIYLNLERIDDIYEIVGRTHKTVQDDRFAEIIEKYKNRSNTCEKFCKYLMEVLKNNKKCKYKEDLDRLEKVLAYIDVIENNSKNIFENELSAKIGTDVTTHTFSQEYKDAVISVMRQYGDYDFLENDRDILRYNHVIRKPYPILLRGSSVVHTLSGQKIDLVDFPSGFSVSSNDVENIVKIEAKALLTIENETAFDRIACPADTLLFYTAGFPGDAEVELLKKVIAEEYMHTGDIDAGGFWIFATIRRKTGLPFIMYRMDVDTLKTYSSICISLTNNDRVRLEKLAASNFEFADVAQYMLEQGVKLEQENIWA